MQLEDHYFESNNIRLHYVTIGSGKPLLFLHGANVSAIAYRKTLECLASRFFVIAPDIPCFGKSTIPDNNWNFIDYARYFSKFINYMTYKKIIVVGHSFGGGIALNLAVQNSKVAQLFLIDSAGIPFQISLNKIWFLLFKKTIHDFLWYQNKLISLSIIFNFAHELFNKIHQVHKISKIVQESTYKNYMTFSKIKQPTEIYWGDKDEIYPKSIAYQIQNLIPHSHLEFVKGNHDWCFLYPEQLLEKIIKYHV